MDQTLFDQISQGLVRTVQTHIANRLPPVWNLQKGSTPRAGRLVRRGTQQDCTVRLEDGYVAALAEVLTAGTRPGAARSAQRAARPLPAVVARPGSDERPPAWAPRRAPRGAR